MRISDWSSDVCSSDLPVVAAALPVAVMVAMVALHRLHVPSGRRPVAVAVPDDDRPPLAAMPAVVFPLVLVVLVMLARVLAVVAAGTLAQPVPATVVVGQRRAGERGRAPGRRGPQAPKKLMGGG